MTLVDGQEVGYSSLIEEGRVHSAVFTDESIFEAELERIFYTYWVYLAHESEVAEPGDYCRKSIGRHSIVVARGTDGAVRAFSTGAATAAPPYAATSTATPSSSGARTTAGPIATAAR